MKKSRRPKASLKKPLWLLVCVILIGLAAIACFVLAARGEYKAASAVGSAAVVVTLLALVVYTYYTGIYAWAAIYPSVSFDMRSPKERYFQFWIQNHSNVPVRCWCKLNPTYGGAGLAFAGSDGKSGFYEGATAFDVLPHQAVHGAAYDLSVFFMRERNVLWSEIQQRVANGELPRMHFHIEFWYEAPDLKFRSATIEHRYYYDFGINKMVLDY